MTSTDPTSNPAPGDTAGNTATRAPFDWWRAATIFLLIVLAFMVATGMSMYEQSAAQIGHLQGQLKKVPQVKYVAVLTDDKGAPGLLVTLNQTEDYLALQRLSDLAEGREDSMQLWALSDTGKPRSLGLLATGIKTLRVPGNESQLKGVTKLAISVESKGGVSDAQGPRLPWLFQGSLVQKAL